MKNWLRHFKVFGKTFLVFSATGFLLIGMVWGVFAIRKMVRQNSAEKRVPEKTLNLPLVKDPVRNYRFTDQIWSLPHYSLYLSPGMWLSPKENCLFSCRLNQMKFAGMIPPHYEISHFKTIFSSNELYDRYKINLWSKTLDSESLKEISARLREKGIGRTNRYRWVSVTSMDELIYLAKRRHHVMVGITIWLSPTRRHPKPKLYLDAPISHALTVTGLKSYDPESGLIVFETDDPLPFGFVNDLPVYNRFVTNGYNLFGRQAIPYLVPSGWAKSGYLVQDDSSPKKP